MLRYAVERLILMVPALIAIAALIFLVIQLPPGDYLTNQIAELQAQGDTSAIAKAEYLRHEHGLDRPVIEQFGIWLGVLPGPRGFAGLLQGDWGWSFEFSKPVAEVVDYALGPTILVNVLAVFVVYLLALPLGIIAAVRQDKFLDYLIAAFAYVALATPGFLLALLILTYSHRWFGLSIGGLVDPDLEGAPLSLIKIGSIAAHLGVAVIVIAFSGVGQMIRRLRANLLDELRKPYVVTARAKGIPERRVLVKYPVRAALNPFVSSSAYLFPYLVSGSIVVSLVLGLPTVGPLLLQALVAQDMFLAGTIVLLLGVLTVLGTLISDLLLMWVEPRIRLQGRA